MLTDKQIAKISDADRVFLQAVAHWLGLITQRAALVERTVQKASATARTLAANELITILAHDLGNYLTPIVGELYLLQRRAARDERRDDVASTERLQRRLQRMQQLIQDLTDTTRLEQGLFTITRHPVDLAALAHAIGTTLRTDTTDIQVQAPAEVVIMGDRERLQQAVENLVSNAVKHASGMPILIEVAQDMRADGAWAVLSVRDHGPGIALDVQAQLFQRFVRGDGSQGLGLGLYLARGIAEAHGGTLTVESQLGQGATFQLALPIMQAPAPA